MLLDQYISIFNLFLKEHVTLKTGVMSAENFVVLLQEYITF